MIHKLLKVKVIISIVLGSGAAAILAQQDSWQRIAPVGQSFTVLMPTRAIEAHRRISVGDQDSLPIAVYYSVSAGKRYMAAGFFKTTPNISPVLTTYQSFMSAMEQSFKGGELAKSLTFEHDVSFKGIIGKQYRIKLGEYPGVARFLGTETAFYVLMVIGAQESDPDVSRFLSSFAVGEVNTSADLNGISGFSIVGSSSTEKSGADSAERADVAVPPEPWPNGAGPITGGVLNGKAISLSVPKYPKEARKAHDSGQVTVQVLIDERGVVISAKAIGGPDSLREVAVNAALQSRFTPTRLMGQPVKVNGVIIYNFVAQ